jgi:hypothetical protein
MPRNHYRRTREQIRADLAALDAPLADPTDPGNYVPRDPAIKEIMRKRLELELITTKEQSPQGGLRK